MKHPQVIALIGACLLLSGCMSQEAATIQPGPGFIREFPNHTESKVRASVTVWLADESLSLRPPAVVQNENTTTIVSDGDMILRPEGSWVSLKVAYTMNVDVKDNRIRIRFSNLRRLYGSVSYRAPAVDDFFESRPGAPFRREARARFTTLVKSLTDFIGVPTRDVAAMYE